MGTLEVFETEINRCVLHFYEIGFRVLELYVNPVHDAVGTWSSCGLKIRIIPDEDVAATTFEFRARKER